MSLSWHTNQFVSVNTKLMFVLVPEHNKPFLLDKSEQHCVALVFLNKMKWSNNLKNYYLVQQHNERDSQHGHLPLTVECCSLEFTKTIMSWMGSSKRISKKISKKLSLHKTTSGRRWTDVFTTQINCSTLPNPNEWEYSWSVLWELNLAIIPSRLYHVEQEDFSDENGGSWSLAYSRHPPVEVVCGRSVCSAPHCVSASLQ